MNFIQYKLKWKTEIDQIEKKKTPESQRLIVNWIVGSPFPIFNRHHLLTCLDILSLSYYIVHLIQKLRAREI